MKPFVTGSLSGSIATACIQPMDMIKVRIQVNASAGGVTSPFAIARTMIAEEGVLSLYNGLSAGLTRQVLYTGARLGLYDVFTEQAKTPGEKSLPFYKTTLCALSAGGLAAVIGNPADLGLIRMQTDSMLPAEQRANYRHAGHALGDILKKEGFLGLFAGVVPTATRAMALNLGMLGGNTVCKDFLADTVGIKRNSATHVNTAALMAGFFASVFSLPFDFVKTQIQRQKPDPTTGKLPFANALACARNTLVTKGPLGFYAGFPTYYFRIAPHAVITLIAQDNVKKAWTSVGL